MKRLTLTLVGLSLLVGCAKAPEAPPAQKPLLLIELTASDCHACREIHPIVDSLRWRYKDWIEFQTLEMTDRGNREDAIRLAQDLNAGDFVRRYQDRPGTVGLLDPQTGLSLGVLQNDTEAEHYQALVEAGFKAFKLEAPKLD